MNVGYSDPVPRVARERAQIIAEFYVTCRTPKPAAAPRHRPARPARPARAFPGLVDGHEATELHPANNVSVTADPS
jgi:hypothetical protein